MQKFPCILGTLAWEEQYKIGKPSKLPAVSVTSGLDPVAYVNDQIYACGYSGSYTWIFDRAYLHNDPGSFPDNGIDIACVMQGTNPHTLFNEEQTAGSFDSRPKCLYKSSRWELYGARYRW